MSRVNERSGFDAGTKIQLLETDMDRNDQEKESIRNELKAMRMVLTGILVSAATASILLAINVVVSTVGGA